MEWATGNVRGVPLRVTSTFRVLGRWREGDGSLEHHLPRLYGILDLDDLHFRTLSLSSGCAGPPAGYNQHHQQHRQGMSTGAAVAVGAVAGVALLGGGLLVADAMDGDIMDAGF